MALITIESSDDDIEIIDEDTELQEAMEIPWESHTDTGVRQIMEDTFSYEETRHHYTEFKRKSYRSSSVEFDLIEEEHESEYCNDIFFFCLKLNL